MLLDKLGKIFDYADKNSENIERVYNYLKVYGYIDDNSAKKIESLIYAVKRFQEVSGLIPTGLIDGKTIKMMSYPRCSMTDRQDINSGYWGINHLTYFIQSYDKDISRSEWGDAINAACEEISKVCNITFEEVNNKSNANIVMGVGSGRRSGFDGPSGTLAYAYLPPYANYKGQLGLYFDADELWIGLGKTGRGIYLKNVACHELGHNLGLTHSKVSTALMAPFYSPNIDRPQQNDDITRLVNLYGKARPKPKPEPDPTPVPDPPSEPSPEGKTSIIIEGNITNIDIPGYRVYKI